MTSQMKRYISKVWKDLCTGAYEFWGLHALIRWTCSPIWKPSEPHAIWILIEASLHMHDQLLIHFQIFPLWQLSGGAENCKLLILAWSFWGPALIQEPSCSTLHQNKRHYNHPGNSKAFRTLDRKQGQKPNIRTKDAPVFLSLRQLTRVLRLCARNQEIDIGKYCFYYLTGFRMPPPPEILSGYFLSLPAPEPDGVWGAVKCNECTHEIIQTQA